MAVPPGGPPDSLPPRIIVTRPDSGVVLPNFKGDAIVRFDELIDEMGGLGGEGKGGGPLSGLPAKIVLSPVAGPVQVSWHRSSIHIKPREGWKKGRVYHLEILPGLADLRHNVMKRGKTVVFSTGPALPHAAVSGTVLQWVEQRAMPQALIRAAHVPDTVAYLTMADSGGNFSLTDIPAGRYRVYAIQDQNTNRQRDDREAFDSITVTVDSRQLGHATPLPTAPLRPTTPRSPASCEPLPRQRRMRLRSNSTSTRVHLFALPDTTPVPVRAVWTTMRFDSIQTRERFVADSLKRARDTTARAGAKRDTIVNQNAARLPRPPVTRDTGMARLDTARIRALLRHRPVPTDRWVVRTGRVLKPGRNIWCECAPPA